MEMTTLQGHLLPGLFIVAVGLLAIFHEAAFVKGAWIQYVMPVAFIAMGLQGLLDKLLHGAAAPVGYELEAAQHMVQGAIILAAGVVELLRAKRVLTLRWWGLVLPLALAFVGVMFLLHAQQGSGAAMLVMLVQHRAYGLTLLLAAAARTISELAPERGARFKVLFPTLLLLLGLQFATYAEVEGGHGAMEMTP